MKDDFTTFPQWKKHFIILAKWQYVLFGAMMVIIGLIAGFLIGKA